MKTTKQYLDPHTPASHVYGMYLTNSNPNNTNFHTHNYCEFMLIMSGSLFHQCNQTGSIISKRQLCFIRASDVHCSSCYRETAELFNIGIPNDLLDTVTDYYDIDITPFFLTKQPPTVTLSENNYHYLSQKIALFMKTDFNELHARIFKNLLSEMLFFLSTPNNSSIHTSYQHNTPDWLLKLLSDMDKKENFVAGLPKLLSLTNFSQEYVNRCFKKYLNTTPTQYINSLRLSYARKLIMEDNMPIIDACYQSGYNSEGYFYKEFKKMYLQTPMQMLKSKNSMLNA